MAEGRKFLAHPQSAPGDFYVEEGQCLACGLPHVLAPDLIGWAEGQNHHCVWKKQPQTSAELERAIAVLQGQELACHRYAGHSPEILDLVSTEYCDYPQEQIGETTRIDEIASSRLLHPRRSSRHSMLNQACLAERGNI
jgi:hypothetical protein